MKQSSIALPVLLGGLCACLTSADPPSVDPPIDPSSDPAAQPERIALDDALLDAAHGWTLVAEGVHRRIDPASGAISTVSVGEAGRRYDHARVQEQLVLVRQQLAEALAAKRDPSALRLELAELEGLELQLAPDPAALGSVFTYDETGFCHNVKGMLLATFETTPRSGGGKIGKVTSEVTAVPCLGFECIPFEDAYATGYRGGTYASVRASNSGGLNATSSRSNGGVSLDMYEYPGTTSVATTPNVADASCTLVASGYINTTLVTTPYQSCYLYKNFSITRTCAQVP